MDSESVNVAINSAISSLNQALKDFGNRENPDSLLNLHQEELLVKEEEIELIVRQSFLYQTRPLEERSEITKEIVKVIDGAIERMQNEI